MNKIVTIEECLKMDDKERRKLFSDLIDNVQSFKKAIEPCIDLAIQLGIEPAIQCSCRLVEKVTKEYAK
ncbi:MAG: hypothetical protein DRP10_02915 [Candidatus Aenigmatarchaeota archaeon]|nr:MAG: hypothetical protein DRP10_02915 [Candidatus Aenigmarchaeota archaeon]